MDILRNKSNLHKNVSESWYIVKYQCDFKAEVIQELYL